MPEPKECRRRAENCRRLATEARSLWGRHALIYMADRWERLAIELEGVEPPAKATSAVILPFAPQQKWGPIARPKAEGAAVRFLKEPPQRLHVLLQAAFGHLLNSHPNMPPRDVAQR
jgi:hypothetical protein